MSKLLKGRLVLFQSQGVLCAAAASGPGLAPEAPPVAMRLQPAVKRQPGSSRADARAAAKGILDQAAQDGLAEGFIEGYRLGLAESGHAAQEELKKIDGVLEGELERARGEGREACGRFMCAVPCLAVRLAAEICRRVLESDENACLGLFENAAAHITEAETAVLKLGPRGAEAAERHRASIEKRINGLKRLEIRQAGGEGTCILETPYGSVDASVSTQLKKAAAAMGCEEDSAGEDDDVC